ncbi:MAG: hypothetical protein IT305_15975 [Chloroflexi bacterium]|nr:hypothetical protein [Chloroflexota bacterium]
MQLWVRLSCLVLAAGIVGFIPTNRGDQGRSAPGGESEEAVLQARGDSSDDLRSVLNVSPALVGQTSLSRDVLVANRIRAARDGDVQSVARLNAIFAAEAFRRSDLVLGRWLPRRDPVSGLFPNSVQPDGQAWVYGDTGSDLFPHLGIATYILRPDRYGEIVAALDAERRGESGVPRDVKIGTGQRLDAKLADRIFGVAEYGKDGLLPLMDETGPDPWRDRLREITDAILAASTTPTRSHGMLPADSTEVNGDMLQILARLYFATSDATYLEAAGRIGRTYLEEVFPTTNFLPPNRWDFVNVEPLDRRRFRLSDHGNEIFSGLIEWHLAETVSGSPRAAEDRIAIRRLLDRLLQKGRNEHGLWYRVLEVPSGRVDQDGLTDNWGYLFQGYLTQAIVESVAPDGDPARAEAYRAAARQGLDALAYYRDYPWQQGEMDGYADTIESAIYLLNVFPDQTAELWVDDQMGVLYGFQAADGSVLERDLDGNFIRTTLLQALRLTAGVRAVPWSPDVLVGSARDGDCLTLWAGSDTGWSGRLLFDVPRHRLYGRMPVNYPRLNTWPEWFTVEADAQYRVEGASGAATATGADLAAGLPLDLATGATQTLRVCPAQ